MESTKFTVNTCCEAHFRDGVIGEIVKMDIPDGSKTCNFSTKFIPTVDLDKGFADKTEFKFDFKDEITGGCSKHTCCKKWGNSNCSGAACGKKRACPGYENSKKEHTCVNGYSDMLNFIIPLRKLHGDNVDKQTAYDMHSELWERVYKNLNKYPGSPSAYSYQPDPHTLKVKYQTIDPAPAMSVLSSSHLPTKTEPNSQQTNPSDGTVFVVNLCCEQDFVNGVTGNLLLMDISGKCCNFSTRLIPSVGEGSWHQIEFTFNCSEISECSKHVDCRKWGKSNCGSADGNKKACPGYTKSERKQLRVDGYNSLQGLIEPMQQGNANLSAKHAAIDLNSKIWQSVYGRLIQSPIPPQVYSFHPDPHTFTIKYQTAAAS